ncbi:hypothetical protein NECID01_1796 [Nematocida sp. AWRm77]|nr:hypothetical protein NECID01_1796 [Nematocida sp. AWRm77]
MLSKRTKTEILAQSGKGRVLIVVGETGSGKSTEVPQVFLRETSDTSIVVTQPRRVAAISLSRRVQALTKDVGKEVVGYTVRFQNATSKKTRLKYVTDGVLLRWMEKHTDIPTVILDEVHERTVRTDILLGMLKKKVGSCRVVLMSATANVDALRAYFEKDGIPVSLVEIEANAHSVDIKYLPVRSTDYIQMAYNTVKKIIKDSRADADADANANANGSGGAGAGGRTSTPETDGSGGAEAAVTDSADVIEDIFTGTHKNRSFASGSILVFLSGLEDIEDLQKLLKYLPGIETLQLHSSMGDAEQRKVFLPREKRIRVILSTNIAETSLTIPDVKWVIDTGVQKITARRNGVDTLGIVRISQASAKQRAGRAGRTGPGMCYRLYTLTAFQEMEKNTLPEIMRTDIGSVCLSLLSLGEDPQVFDYLESPGKGAIHHALRDLFILGLIDKRSALTELGRKVSQLPLSPAVGKFFVVSQSLGIPCTGASVCAVLSADTNFLFTRKDVRVSSVHAQPQKESDLTVCAALFFNYLRASPALKKDLCQSLGMSFQEMRTAERVYHQLLSLASTHPQEYAKEGEEIDLLKESRPAGQAKAGCKEAGAGSGEGADMLFPSKASTGSRVVSFSLVPSTADKLHFSGSVSFLTQIGRALDNQSYMHLYSKQTLYLHPGSSLFRKQETMVGFVLSAYLSKPYILCAFPYTPHCR